jgi:hypothetical protein
VAETLTNTAKHAHASVVDIDLDTADGHTGEGADVLRVCVPSFAMPITSRSSAAIPPTIHGQRAVFCG